MIQTDGGFYLQLDIGAKKDFIKEAVDLLEFTVIESVGNALPEFILTFITRDESIMGLLHEGTPIVAIYGKGQSTIDTVTCYTGKIETQKEGAQSRSFSLSGLCVDQTYITDHVLKIHAQQSAVALVLAIAKTYFKRVDTNITDSADSQVWIQPSLSDKAFVSKTLMHADLPNSFPLCAITADGTFILRDAVKTIQNEKPKWRFVPTSANVSDIEYLADGIMESNSSFINNWTGYAKVTKVLDLIKNTVSNVSTVFKPLLSMSTVSEVMSGISYRFKGFKPQSDSVHANYWASADRNLVYASQMSKLDVTHSFVDVYHDIKPLDLAFIQEYGVDDITSSDYTTGLYLVSAVSRSIQNKKFITTVGFNRESLSKIKNLGVL